jgi:hypothetical protein
MSMVKQCDRCENYPVKTVQTIQDNDGRPYDMCEDCSLLYAQWLVQPLSCSPNPSLTVSLNIGRENAVALMQHLQIGDITISDPGLSNLMVSALRYAIESNGSV